MTQYAANTDVSTDKTVSEIQRTLTRYGADAFCYGWESNRGLVTFRIKGKHIRIIVPLPNKNDNAFYLTPKRSQMRTRDQAVRAWEQACRQRWRAMALVIKAKLEAVDTGITTLETEFLAHILLPNGRTVGEMAIPEITKCYADGIMPRSILMLEESEKL
jgi:hypothetical protein